MGKEESFSNIFDAAGKLGKKPISKEIEAAPSMPQGPVTDEELEAQFARCMAHHAEIKKEIEDAYEQHQLSPQAIEKYLETPTNFPDQDWRRIEKTRRENEEKLKKLYPKKKPPEEPPGEESKKEGPRPTKPKSGFIPKKKWISMR